jgi:tryptophanase
VEPYRIKVVEPLPVTSWNQRLAALDRVGYNLMGLASDEVTIDLLTDSGTGALSAQQLSHAITGDESYAGSRSYRHFVDVAVDLTSYPFVFPVPQGRVAERVLFSALVSPGRITLSNAHFETTRANVWLNGGQAIDLPCPELADLASSFPFKGDIDTARLKEILFGSEGDRVAAVIMTITNNTGGGQPVAMSNLRTTAELCNERGVPLILDAARFAENAWLVGQNDAQHWGRTPREIAQEAFTLADGCVLSAKKDGLAHIGGLLGLRDPALARRCELILIATTGYSNYGGLAGRDLDMVARGLVEVTDPRYLRSRAEDAAYLADLVRAAGVRMVEPPGLHALYLDAGALLPHIPPSQFPGQALACELYLEAGIRSTEVGSFNLGDEGDHGHVVSHELLRLAIPRRVYTRAHLAYVGRAIARIADRADQVTGLRIVEQPPMLRGFTARLQRVAD